MWHGMAEIVRQVWLMKYIVHTIEHDSEDYRLNNFYKTLEMTLDRWFRWQPWYRERDVLL